MSLLARILLALASLAPGVGLIAFRELTLDDGNCAVLMIAFAFTILASLLCWLVLHLMQNKQAVTVAFQCVDSKPHDVIPFLLAYLLPLLSLDSEGSQQQLVMYAAVMALIAWVLVTSDALHFNPVMSLLGYRFYFVQTKQGATYLFISRRELMGGEGEIGARKLTSTIYLVPKRRDA